MLSVACHVGGSQAGDLGTFSLADGRADQAPHARASAARADAGPEPTTSDVATTDAEAADSRAADARPADEPLDAAPFDAGARAASAADSGGSHDAAAAAAAPSSWPRLGYDLGSTFCNSAETVLTKANAADLRVRFTLAAGNAIYGPPLLVDDKLYFTDARGVHAYKIADGALVWELIHSRGSTDQIATNSLAYDDGKIYVHLRNADVLALDAQNGEMLWRSTRDAEDRYDRGYGSPIVAGELVLLTRSAAESSNGLAAGRFLGKVIAQDKRDGSERWRAHMVADDQNGAGIWSAPAVSLDLGLLYVPTGPSLTTPEADGANALVSLVLASGELRFSTHVGRDENDVPAHGSTGFEHGASPIQFEVAIQGVTQKLMAAGTRTGVVHVLDAATGAHLWEHKLGPGSEDGDQGILANGAWSGEHLLYALNEGTGASNASTLYALDPANGKIVWSLELGSADVLGRITVANGVGFVGVGAELVVFDAEAGSVIQRVPTGGPTAAGVASIANGVVAFGTGASYLAHDDAAQGKLIVLEVPQP